MLLHMTGLPCLCMVFFLLLPRMYSECRKLEFCVNIVNQVAENLLSKSEMPKLEKIL